MLVVEDIKDKFGNNYNFIQNTEWEVLTSEGWQDFDGISRSVQFKSLIIQFTDGTEIEITENHKLMLQGNKYKICGKDITSGIVIHNNKTVKKVFKKTYSNAPKYFYDLIKVQNGNHYTTNGIETSNCAWVHKNKWDGFISSVYPTISSSKKSKIFQISTPNGLNHFYKTFNDAENERNGYSTYTAKWDCVPGRNEEFRQKTIKEFGMKKWLRDYEVAFLGSSDTLLSSTTLERLEPRLPISEKYNGDLLIYEEPKKNVQYIMTIDLSEGTGNGDYHAFNIIKVNSIIDKDFEQVAIFRNNKIPPYEIPIVIVDIAKYFNNSLIIYENNITFGLGDIIFQDLDYENIIRTNQKNGKTKMGIRTTQRTKLLGASALRNLLEKNKLKINDYNTIQELSVFVKQGNTYKASPGEHDDIIMSLLLFGMFFSDKKLIEKYMDINNEMNKIYNNIEEVRPFFMSNIVDDFEDNIEGISGLTDITNKNNEHNHYSYFKFNLIR